VTDLALPIPPELLDALCDALLPRLLERLAEREPDSEPRYLSVRQAAAYAGMTEHAIRHAIARDGLPIIQEAPGHRIRIDRLALDRHLTEGEERDHPSIPAVDSGR
jgi:hypothetical protein